jgi:hypothetical protein
MEKHLGVRFAYRPTALSEVHGESAGETGTLTLTELSHLPAGWLEEFVKSLRSGRSAQLLSLINRIPPEHAGLAHTLVEMVRIHRFDTLLAATEGALKGTPNG